MPCGKKQLTVKQVTELMAKYRKRGLKPYLKGSKGSVKIEFED